MRPVTDPYGGINPIIDKMIGNAYDIVKYVAKYLREIRYVAENMGTIFAAANLTLKSTVIAEGTGANTLLVPIVDAIPRANIENIAVLAVDAAGNLVFPANNTFSYVFNMAGEVFISIASSALLSSTYRITVTYRNPDDE